MNDQTTGGAISFEMLVETGQLDRALEESTKRIKGISRESVAAGKAIDDFFGATTDNVKIQKDVITGLEKKYGDLQKEIDKLAPGKAQAQLRKEAIAIKAELDAEKATLTDLESAVKQNEKAHISLRTQIKNVKDEMGRMVNAGKENTAEYKALANEAGRLVDVQKDVTAQANILAHDQKGLQGVISGLSGVAGAMSAAVGAYGLFAGENENLQKIMLKVQSLMAVTIGLQQIQQTFDKDSAFKRVTLVKLNNMYAASLNRLTIALGGSTVAAKALMATLTLGLSAAIGIAIYYIDRYISKQKEAAKKQEEFSKAISEEAYKSVASIEMLSAKYKSLGDNMKAKEKFVKDNVKAFDDLSVSIRNVSDAENILNENKKKFIEAQIQKAKALAATQIAADKVKELIQTELKIQETPKTILTETKRGFGPQPQSQEEIKNPALVKLESEKKGIEGEIKSLYELSDKADSISKEILKALGVTGDETMGIIEKLKKELADLESKKEKSKSGSEILTLNKEIEAKRSELSKYELKDSRTSSKDPLVEQLEKKKKLYQDYFNWINSNRPDLTEGAKKEFEDLLKGGNSFMDYIEKQAMELEGKRGITDEQKKQLKTIRDYIATEVKTTALDTFERELTAKLEAAKTALEKMSILNQATPTGTTDLDKAKQSFIDSEKEKTIREEKELTKELLANYAGYLQEKIQFNETYAEKKRLLNLAFEKAENEDSKKIALEALAELERKKDQYNNKSGNKDYDQLVERYKNFKQQLDELITDFDKQVKLALDNGNKELADTILKAKEEEVKKLVTSLSSKEAGQVLEDLKRSLAVQIEISLATGEQTAELFKIKAVIDLINKALKAESKEDIVKGLDLAISSLQQISGIMGDIDEQSKAVVDRLIKVADGLAQIYSGNVFQGATQILFTIADGLDKQFGMQRKIADIEATRVKYNKDLSFTLESINYKLEKQLKIFEGMSLGSSFGPSIEAIKVSIREASAELEKLKFDLLKSPPNVKIELDIEHLKKIFKTNDIAEALGGALSNGLISEEQYNIAINYIRTIEDGTERIKQLKEKYNEYITGTTADSIIDSIVSGFEQGKLSAEDFADNFEKLMKRAMLQAIKMKYLEGPLQQWYETFAAYSEDGLTPEEIAALREAYNQIINNAAAQAQNIQDITGSVAGLENSLSGAVKGVTEQTAGLIAGQMNAIRMNQAQALMLMDDQLSHLTEIASNTRYNRLLLDIKNILQSNSSNTANQYRANGGS